MKILLTGSSGRIGRAIHARLGHEHEVVGYDMVPAATTQLVAPLQDAVRLRSALDGVEAVVHCAALHAPHVGIASDVQFVTTNVTATETLAWLCCELGVRHLVFTSTTALYGLASTLRDSSSGTAPASARWITEETEPVPRTIYHRSKLAAEAALASIAASTSLAVTVIRMSRCFPESAPLMAAYRLHRGVDARDVAEAHALALGKTHGSGFHRYVVTGATPFEPSDADELARDAPSVIWRRAPDLARDFAQRGWPLPRTIDRVVSPAKAQVELGWQPRFGYREVMEQLDRGAPEVLAP